MVAKSACTKVGQTTATHYRRECFKKVSTVMAVFCNSLYNRMKRFLYTSFYKFGRLVGLHPVAFSVTPLVLLLAMGLGVLVMEKEEDTERLFTPVTARIYKDRVVMSKIFPDTTSWNFDAFGLVDVPSMAIVIFRAVGAGQPNVFDPANINFTKNIVEQIDNLTAIHDGIEYTMDDLCARYAHNACASDGIDFIKDNFLMAVNARRVTYPMYKIARRNTDLSVNLAMAHTTTQKIDSKSIQLLTGASVLKIRYYWRVDRKQASVAFNKQFLNLMRKVEKEIPKTLDMAYSTSESLEKELLEGTQGDIKYFGLTMACMVVYSVMVTAGGDAVSTRALLACGGVLAALLGIFGSMGFLSLCGLKFVNFVGIMPFLVIGIGVDDMFLLMSAWGESVNEIGLDVPGRVGVTFAKAGVGITITSLTDFLAFLIGFTSDFIAVRHFCVYTGVAVLLCYLANATLFGACLALHGKRVYSGHHWLTCRPAKSREALREQGACCCKVICCGGSVPGSGYSDESIFEKLPRIILPRLILNPIFKVLLAGACVTYLYFAIKGTMKLQSGMKYIDLVLKSSYYYKYSNWDTDFFGQRLAIAFAVNGETDYRGKTGAQYLELISKAQGDRDIENAEFARCWLDVYKKLPTYNDSDPLKFVTGLREMVKSVDLMMFQNDVKFDATETKVIAARCYVLTKNVVNPFRQAEIMQRMRTLADNWPNPKVFVYNPIFVMLEHTIAVVPATTQTVVTAVVVMFVVTYAFLPQPLMVVLVTLNILAILVGVFGSMYYLDITFSGMSMIHLLMSIGFSVDFSAHICAAYLMSDARTRKERAEYAIVHASGPILNGGTSSLLGVAMLLFSQSYFFVTFFEVMSMVILSGAWHAVFVMPVVLSFIGPENTHKPNAVGTTTDVQCAADDFKAIQGSQSLSGDGEPLPDVLPEASAQSRSMQMLFEKLQDMDSEIKEEEAVDKTANALVPAPHLTSNSGQSDIDFFARRDVWSTAKLNPFVHATNGTVKSTGGSIHTGVETRVHGRLEPIRAPLYRAVLNDISLSGQLGASQAYTREVEFPLGRDSNQLGTQNVDLDCEDQWDTYDLSSEGLGTSQSYAHGATKS